MDLHVTIRMTELESCHRCFFVVGTGGDTVPQVVDKVCAQQAAEQLRTAADLLFPFVSEVYGGTQFLLLCQNVCVCVL